MGVEPLAVRRGLLSEARSDLVERSDPDVRPARSGLVELAEPPDSAELSAEFDLAAPTPTFSPPEPPSVFGVGSLDSDAAPPSVEPCPEAACRLSLR